MLNRSVCEVLDEMRKCYETHNFSYLLGLIEEVQSMANRMEAKIQDVNDFNHLQQRYRDLKRECMDLQECISELEKKKENLENECRNP